MVTNKKYNTSNGIYSIKNCMLEIRTFHYECFQVIKIMEKDNVKLENILDNFIDLFGIIDWKTFECNFYSLITKIFLDYDVGIDNIKQISEYLFYKSTKYHYISKYISDIKIFEDLSKILLDTVFEINNHFLR